MAKQTKRSTELSQFIAERGEAIFKLAITDYREFDMPLFRPAFLGDKWPALDYLVELTGVSDMTPMLFVQVKSTTRPITNDRLEVAFPPKQKRPLVRIPGPTYLVGVQETTKRAFIRAINDDSSQGVYHIPSTHELTPANLRILYDEVKTFWRSQNFKPQQSAFA